ncbi:diguanylate cyclase domain-containing protein [Marinomonas profundimaris]|uniref:diguanylate cyclase domain-containing protein n=1 Tax=Marinomonas profundimaris TaxID=1208321 RepID=UPI00190F75AA|nr:diguanylate cyclase [Marinomonas profundimaris]
MPIDSSNSLLKEQQVLQSRIAYLEKERDFIKGLYSDMPQVLNMISKGALLSTLLGNFKNKLQAQLPNAYCLFIVCDKDCSQWRLQYKDSINGSLLSSNGQLVTVPQALITFAASPSCPKRHDINIQSSVDWKHWQPFFKDHGFSDASIVSVSDGQGSIYLMLAFQREETLLEGELMALALDSYASWLDAVFEREKADYQLLEDSHRDPSTGLLRRFSFDNSFGIVLKDSRRHFQRAALLSIRLLSTSKVDDAELKVLADIMQETVRDNDLIAHYDERELVMGIRIQHLEDAEIVATKLLKSLSNPRFSTNRLIRDGLSVGIAFYPEHSSLEQLHQAASFASDSLSNAPGFRFEFHGSYYGTSAELYSL